MENLLIQDIETVLATKADYPGIKKLLLDYYKELGWSHEYIDWQYLQNPAGPAKCWIAKVQSEVIALYVAIPHFIDCDGVTSLGWRVQDVLTHPKYQGMGLYSKLSNMANSFLKNEKFPANFTFPNEKSHSGFMRRNWMNPNRIPLWTINSFSQGKLSQSNLEIETISTFSESDFEVWKSYSSTVRFGVQRSASYLNWRYTAKPNGGYSAFRLKKGGKTAICILKIFSKSAEEKYAHLCDIFYESSFEAIPDLVKFFLKFSADNGAKMASTWSQPEAPLSAQLRNSGFTLNDQLSRWHVLNFNNPALSVSDVKSSANWHISMGDSDVY